MERLHLIHSSDSSFEKEQLRQLDRAAIRLSFLSEVSRRLSFALTDQECFRELLYLMVPDFADWATLCLMNERDEILRLAAAHVNPEKAKLLTSIVERYPPHIDDPTGPGAVIRERKAEFIPDYGDHLEENIKLIRYPEIANMLRTLGVRSKICVPLEAQGKVLGALWLATSESGRRFDEEDLSLAEEVARRAAVLVYHLLRYEQASRALEKLQVERDVREEYFKQTRHDVLSILSAATLSAQMIANKDPAATGEYAKRVIEAVDRVSAIFRK